MKFNRKIKRPDTSSKLVLEEIIGLTTKNSNGLASSLLNSNCVYSAGCVVVVYNVNSGSQSHLMVSHRMPKPLSCVAVSQDGRFVAAGESGHQPALLIWDSSNLAFVSEIQGKHLVSVGFPHDGYICLWDWRSGLLITKLKSSSSCSAAVSVCFSSDGKFIITSGGKKHLKFWSIRSSMRLRSATGAGSLTMHGKTVNVCDQKGNSFVSVVSSVWTDGDLIRNGSKHAGEFLPIYALTDAGILCLLNSGFSVQKSVDLKVGKGFALSASNKLIACACSNGIVQLLTLVTLNHAGSLLYSESKKCHDADDMICHLKNTDNDLPLTSSLPDAIACQFSTSEKLVVVYEDHSLYIWDVRDVCKATRCCVLVSHSACIWDIKNLYCENMHNPSLACVARGCSGGVSFATCSDDGTIRLWDLALQSDLSEDISTNLATGHHSINTTRLVSAGIFERDTVESGVGTQGFRSIAVSSDGKYLAAGDCLGNLHIYNLQTSDYTCVQGAHDAEILSLSFSLPSKKDESSDKITETRYFLASGGRDRIIHLYDVERNFDLIESIDDHSAAVTCVNFTCNGSKILSCSADRSLMFRDVAITDTGCKVLLRHHQMASHGTVYDMAVDPTMEVVITVGQDKQINTFSIAAGKLIKSFKQNGNFGDPIKITMDPSCSYLLCSYSNKSICIYDFITGEMVTRAMGHGEVITSLVFLPDCKHIISVGGDGCIFVWKLPAHLSSRMLQKLENSSPLSPSSMVHPVAISQFIFHEVDDQQNKINPENKYLRRNFKNVNESVCHQRTSPQKASAFKFSISRLPKWAQDKVTSSDILPRIPECTSSQQEELNNLCPLVANGEGYALLCPEVQTPSKLDVGDSEQRNNSLSTRCSDTDNSQSSPTPQKHLDFAMDRRWHTIHTVCLDLLDSPEVWDWRKEKTSVPASNLLQDSSAQLPMNNEHKEVSLGGYGVGNYFSVDLPLAHDSDSEHPNSHSFCSECKNNVQYRIQDASACLDAVVSEVSEQLKSKSTESEVQAINFESQDNDLFDQNFGNLSTTLKIESRKSSVRRRYSSRFTVRRDHIKGGNRLFNTSIQDVGGNETLNCRDIMLEDQPIPKLEEQNMLESVEQDLKKSEKSLWSPSCSLSRSESTKCSVMEGAVNIRVINARDQKENVPEATELQERVIGCKEALLSLDAAAESVLQLFSKLTTLFPIAENSNAAESQLYNGAAELLPSIVEKIHAVSNLVQSKQKQIQ